ncbi:MAG: 6,7-dimethyl-8-ribityllumazine synthase [Bacteroidetes bacterium]|nr:6,7-dimethyl-8-ribityllumazine synthase [Bacteroidota bacterium]
MATKNNNLSIIKGNSKININPNERISIVYAEWNSEVTTPLMQGAKEKLIEYGIAIENIHIHAVPGAFELVSGCKLALDYEIPSAVIAIGCVIQGETKHFDYICSAVTQGITTLNTTYDIPCVFGVLTTDNLQQALDRAGGKHGNKGHEAAITAVKMIELRNKLEENFNTEFFDEEDFEDD